MACMLQVPSGSKVSEAGSEVEAALRQLPVMGNLKHVQMQVHTDGHDADLECGTKSCAASACCAVSRDAAARCGHLAASEDLY